MSLLIHDSQFRNFEEMEFSHQVTLMGKDHFIFKSVKSYFLSLPVWILIQLQFQLLLMTGNEFWKFKAMQILNQGALVQTPLDLFDMQNYALRSSNPNTGTNLHVQSTAVAVAIFSSIQAGIDNYRLSQFESVFDGWVAWLRYDGKSRCNDHCTQQ